jgi:hypothetical protein
MGDVMLNRIQRKIWKQVLGENSWLSRNGDFRTREQYGLSELSVRNVARGELGEIARKLGATRSNAAIW